MSATLALELISNRPNGFISIKQVMLSHELHDARDPLGRIHVNMCRDIGRGMPTAPNNGNVDTGCDRRVL